MNDSIKLKFKNKNTIVCLIARIDESYYLPDRLLTQTLRVVDNWPAMHFREATA